jgi:hypothetical protein
MHMHLVRIAARPKEPLRPAKVVVLETRRKARLEVARPQRQPPAACRVRDDGAARLLHGRRLRRTSGLRMWRNWDTHRPQKPAASAMRVRLPPSALSYPRAVHNERRVR